MSDPKFDLRLDNYSCSELESLFDLQFPYTDAEIEKSLNALTGSMGSSSNSESHDVVKFLRSAADKLKSIKASGECNTNHHISQNGLDGSPFLEHNSQSGLVKPSLPHAASSVPVSTVSAVGRVAGEGAAPRGILNPTHTHTITKLITIDSRFRNNYGSTSASDFTIQLPYRISRATSMSLLEAQIPFTWFSISQARGNNTFRLVVHDGSGEKVIPVTVPDGNYTTLPGGENESGTIAYAVNTAICHALHVTMDDARIVFRTELSTGRGVFGEQWDSQGAAPTFRLVGLEFNTDVNDPAHQDYNTPAFLKLGWELGFRASEYRGPTPEPSTECSQNIFVSESVVMAQGPTYGYIAITDFQNNVSQGFTQAVSESSLPVSDIVSKISLQDEEAAFGTVVSVLGTSVPRTYFGPVDISKLRVRFIDEYGRTIDLNGIDWNLTLSFDCVYDKN